MIVYKFWHWFYKVTFWLKLWELEYGVDNETGIPYTRMQWFWQDKLKWAFFRVFRVPHYDYFEVDYLWRLRVVQTPWFGLYLHKLGTPDPRKVLHSHPFAFLSIILNPWRGGYTEYVPGGDYAVPKKVRFWNVKTIKNSYHWIDRMEAPTWTLVFVGPRRRVWGYLEPDGTYTDFNLHKFNTQYEKALASRKG